ncbi:MAG: alpha/beta hydrolase [Gammaproteobacteria bacterium]|nr:alpha/beta hydrolase [Gammaproteobacteria bacterium]
MLGHSLGAGISCMLAAAFPERVEALVLIDGIGPLSGHEDEAAARLRRAIVARGAATRERGPHPSVDSAVAARLRATRMAPESARLIVERNLREVDGGFAWRTDRRLTFPSPLYLTESRCWRSSAPSSVRRCWSMPRTASSPAAPPPARAWTPSAR